MPARSRDEGELAHGVYEHVVTEGLDRRLRPIEPARVRRVSLEPADAHELLTRHLAALTRQALRAAGRASDADAVARQVELANRIARAIAELAPPEATDPEDLVAASHDLLQAIAAPPRPPEPPVFPPRPTVPLSASALLVNGRGQPGIGAEIRRELASADRVDLLCAFIKVEGLRLIEDSIREFVRRGGRMRVLTTTYLGATQRTALDRLVSLGAEVRVSYETRSTRLHAKAWLFRRNTGLDSAYIGSSNLSHVALVDGLEWNVRLSAAEQPHLIDTFAATFGRYWDEHDFEPYDPVRDRDRLNQALAREKGGPADLPIEIAALDVRPWSFQAEILYELDAERTVHDRWHNLVVMATGTGKTVVAALDYRRLRQRQRVDSLLFVAHREEILRQSLSTFRQVMRDGAFGELLVGGKVPTQWRHVFASIQSLHRVDIDPARFDMVIVDEFHHAEAATYTRLLDHLRPTVLLGLTATPERADGGDIKRWFGGRIASELRLWEALERNLLVPFHYFGINDEVSVERVRWRRGRYDEQDLSNLYTGNDARVRMVLAALAEKIPNVRAMRAVGFCVSIAHAQFMASKFTAAGIPSLAVTAQSTSQERAEAQRALRDGRVNALFTVDLYNEGVDIPTIDTVLFLRPTESATVFLQQLGRGLRQADGKSCLTVLDFVGAQHAEFRFDLRYRALTGISRRRLEAEIEQGFPTLPAGCHIQLDPVVAKRVLENVRRGLSGNWPAYVAELRRLGPTTTLETFLHEAGIELTDIYRPTNKGGWTGLRRAAGLDDRPSGPDDAALGRRLSRMLHIDDLERLQGLRELIATSGALPPTPGPRHGRLREMLRILLLGLTTEPVDAHLQSLGPHQSRLEELAELVDALHNRIRRVTTPLDPGGPVPLHVHARYRRNEALAAFGDTRSMREGVRYIEHARADLFFVTLNKTEAHFSPTTMYADRAITPELFQWESQSTLTQRAPTAQRYINHEERGSTVHLFLRESAAEDGQLGRPAFFYAGPMSYVEHHGERPVRFTWRLHHPLPADIFHEASPAP